ncbi:MAG: hypothetical protein KJO64_00095 [Bacteroidia bacterium]|nr:hypothetical protein [Bacteroidia bacterium]NNC85827.1 hypothetical protein [Bacteroidia bacterium]
MNEKEYIKDTGCCPRFNPEPWDGKELEWKDNKFVKDHVTSVFHMPLNFGKVIERNRKKIQMSNQKVVDDIVLSDEKSLWGSDVFINVNEDIPDTEMVKLNGTFLTKVFEGPYSDFGKWSKQMEDYILSKGMKSEKFYFWYTTCPGCAKAYGKNYVVLFAKVD